LSDRRFGEGPPLALGVEEELMILDADTLLPVPAVATLVEDSSRLELPGVLKTELFASVVELNTRPCATAAEALEGLRTLRREAGAIAARHGLRLAAAGSHAVADPETQEIVDEPRYLEFVEYAGVTARRQGVNGLHVHVAVPDEESCLHVLESMLPWLPLFFALSANSPYLAGRQTGLASNRAEVLGQLPRHGAPPVFRTFADWERTVERMTRLGLAADYSALWWDARPHPRLGTLEVRAFDQPTSVALSGAYVALVQALAATLLERDAPAEPFDRALYEEARWAAAYRGPRALLPDAAAAALHTVPDLAAQLLELVGPAAEELGSTGLLAALDPSRCEGDSQLAAGAGGDLRAVTADVVERTLAGASCE
jgi:glutamate---cysteine ligase / carboxylate-amine ligase